MVLLCILLAKRHTLEVGLDSEINSLPQYICIHNIHLYQNSTCVCYISMWMGRGEVIFQMEGFRGKVDRGQVSSSTPYNPFLASTDSIQPHPVLSHENLCHSTELAPRFIQPKILSLSSIWQPSLILLYDVVFHNLPTLTNRISHILTVGIA